MATQATTAPALGLRRGKTPAGELPSLPELYRTATRGAKQSQGRYFLLLRVELIAVVVAAIAQFALHPFGRQIAALIHFQLGNIQIFGFSFSSTTVTNTVAASLVSAAAVLFAIGAAALRFYLKLDEQWYQRRALAESVIGLAWRYSMEALAGELPGASPTAAQGDGGYAREYGVLLESARRMDLPPPPSGVDDIITPMMRALRQETVPDKRTSYFAYRLDDQNNFYMKQAHQFHTSRNRLRWVVVGCYSVGALLLPFNGLAAMTTAAGSVGTWLAAKHYSDLSQSYSAMARELGVLRTQAQDMSLNGPLAASAWGQFVNELETKLDGEHQDWRGRIAQQIL